MTAELECLYPKELITIPQPGLACQNGSEPQATREQPRAAVGKPRAGSFKTGQLEEMLDGYVSVGWIFDSPRGTTFPAKEQKDDS